VLNIGSAKIALGQILWQKNKEIINFVVIFLNKLFLLLLKEPPQDFVGFFIRIDIRLILTFNCLWDFGG